MEKCGPLDDLSIVIPAYNEEKRITATLESIFEFLKNRSRKFEIIVVDDGSSDNTAAIVENLKDIHPELKLVRNGVNRGKGFSVRNGVAESSGQYCLFTDADSSSPVENILLFLPFAGENKIVIGSRKLKQSQIRTRQPFFREFIGRGFNFLVRMMVFRGIKDTQCGFKMFSRKIAKDLFPMLTIDGFAFDVELLYLCRKMGFEIAEVPISWKHDDRSTIKPFRDSLMMFYEILKIRYRHRRK
jgi:dolichyl-phosphate beta-glucosyltransferase